MKVVQTVFPDSSKPREERDFHEIYPDLDETAQLKVFVVHNDESLDEYHQRLSQNQPIVGPLKKAVYRIVDEYNKESKNETKFSKSIIDYGFQDGRSKSERKRKLSYIRPFQTENNEKIEDFITKKRKQVEYDMDEQDHLYLQHRNEASGNTLKITPEIFEILMTVLENEWMDLENRMKSITNDDESMNNFITLGRGVNNDKYGDDDGIVFGTVDDQKCAVCNDSDCDNSNAIVFCDGCDIAVHQECYGIAFIPEGQWLCRKCMINNKEVGCVFCPSKTGAFKQLDNSLWSHVVCAIWINELYFANPIYMEPIEGIDLIPKSRWKLNCYICKQKMGACIQCYNRNCFQAYHVTCAKRAGLYMAMTKGVQGAINNKTTLISYCDKHTPQNHSLAPNDIISGINKTRLYYRDMKIINMQNDKLTKNKKLNNKLNIFKWKTENNTPIAPKGFSSILFEKLVQLKVEDIQHETDNKTNLLKNLGHFPNHTKSSYFDMLDQISNDICKYWCLKRDYKNGAPLIRKNNNLLSFSSILYGNNNNSEEVKDKIQLSQLLNTDLKKVIELTESTLIRQQFEWSSHQSEDKLIKMIYFPINTFIDKILSELDDNDKTRLLRNYKPKSSEHAEMITLHTIRDKNSKFKYRSINELNKDLKSFKSVVLSENKSTNSVVKSLMKYFKYYESNFKRYLLTEDKINKDFGNNYLKLPIEVQGRNIGVVDDGEELSDLSDIESLTETDELNLSNFLINSL